MSGCVQEQSKGGSNVRARVPTKAAEYRRHCRIDGSFRLRATRINGSHVAGTFASDGGAGTNERRRQHRRGLRRLLGWIARLFGSSWLVLVASGLRGFDQCGDPLRRTQKCPGICGPSAGAWHVLYYTEPSRVLGFWDYFPL
jgi:hypothetical protein